MRRVLMVSPHFPPDTTAASHRVRLLAPHLPDFGWEPTIVTVDPRDYEGRLDPGLAALVDENLRVVRVRAIPAAWTRWLLVGDLGIRSFVGIARACRSLLNEGGFDCFFVTIYPAYTALIGPLLKRRRRELRFVLDFQDPWVGSWGLSTGPGPDGSPDWKSRLSRTVALVLEPIAVRAADAITAVSAGTLDGVRARGAPAKAAFAEIPIGGEARDFEYLRAHPRTNPYFDSDADHFQLCYVGTLLPAGLETLRGFLRAVAMLRSSSPELYRRLKVRFFGTSNQTTPELQPRVLPEARSLGVEDAVFEQPGRIDYLDALNVLVRSSAILLLGSSEKHYTASKLYPALLARRPILAAFHEQSTVVSILRGLSAGGWCKLVTYDERDPATGKSEVLHELLKEMVTDPPSCDRGTNLVTAFEEYSARRLAGRLASVFDAISSAQ